MGLSCNDSKGTGKRCTLAHIDSKKHRYACNEIKLPVKEFDADRTARDGHARAARCATPQPEQRGGSLMPKSDMIGTEGEITAMYRGGVRHAEG